MIATILAGLSPFLLNGVVSLTKWAGNVKGTAGIRFLLALFSLIGVIALNALNGTPVDVNSVSSLIQTAIESPLAFLASHGSYHLFLAGSPAPVVTPQ